MMSRTGQWEQAGAIALRMRSRFVAGLAQATMKEGHFLRGKIVQGIASQAPGGVAFKALSPGTLALRRAMGFGGSKALIRTGALRAGVTVVRLPGASPKVFVGILRQAKAGGGGKAQSLANVGAIQELGATIKKTERMRRFLAAKLRGAGIAPSAGGGKKDSIIIPPRPFIRPVIAKYARPADVKRRFYQNLAASMGGDFGVIAGK